MRYRGEIIGESQQPLFDGARYLLAHGLASPNDRIETYRGKTMCLAGPVWAAAKLSVSDGVMGPRFVLFRKFPGPPPHEMSDAPSPLAELSPRDEGTEALRHDADKVG
jgi:hypothetical protein